MTFVALATNKLIATTLSGIAEFENNRRKKRQKQAIRAAQKEGKYAGRKTLINKVKDLKENKNLSVTEISRVIGISRPTIYKVLKEHLGYESNRMKQMSKNKLSFESENLVVDWIGFNSTLTIGLDGKEESLFNESKNKYQVSFRVYKYSEIYCGTVLKLILLVRTVINFISLFAFNLISS